MLEGKSADFSPFRPGMSTTIDIITNRVANVLSVPIAAVTTRDSVKSQAKKVTEVSNAKVKECVFVFVDGKVKMKFVKTGIQDNMNIQILEGLTDADQVVTSPFRAISKSLKDGDVVKVVPKEELFAKEE